MRQILPTLAGLAVAAGLAYGIRYAAATFHTIEPPPARINPVTGLPFSPACLEALEWVQTIGRERPISETLEALDRGCG